MLMATGGAGQIGGRVGRRRRGPAVRQGCAATELPAAPLPCPHHDSYEGLWRVGKAEGPGRYVWVVGNEYDGEWRAGRMHGQGTLKWKSGEGRWQRRRQGRDCR